MNRNMTILILVAVLGAMGLIFYANMQASAPQPAVSPVTVPATASSPSAAQEPAGAPPQPSSLGVPSVPQAGARPATPTRSGQEAATAPVQAKEAAPAPAAQAVPAVQPLAQAEVKAVEKPAVQPVEKQPVKPVETAAEKAGAPAAKTPAEKNAAAGDKPAATLLADKPAQKAVTTPAATVLADTPGGKPAAQPAAPQGETPPAAQTGEKPAGKTEPAPSATGELTLKSIGVDFAGQQMKLRIEASGPFTAKVFALPNPERLVIDLPGKWQQMQNPTVPGNKIVTGARLGKQENGYRIVLDLAGPLKKHNVVREGNVVEVFVQ